MPIAVGHYVCNRRRFQVAVDRNYVRIVQVQLFDNLRGCSNQCS